MTDYGTLEIVWIALIAVCWTGYFLLEGFDFGVGMLLRYVGRDRNGRRAVIHTIGPIWDGNEVWLIVAGGATFAAFPDWYATLFSGFYIPLFLVVAGLVLRPVALEFWGKSDRPAWRNGCEWALALGSAVPALLWGVAFANIVRGVPIDGNKEFTGSLLDLLNPYALLGGLTFLLLCAAQGATFLTLKLDGEPLARARRATLLLTPAAAVALVGFVAWTLVHAGNVGTVGVSVFVAGIAAAASAALVPVLARLRVGWAFAANSLAIASLLATLFLDLYPNVLVSSTSAAYDLTLGNAASGHYTLSVITVVAVVMLPLIVLSQAWAYWVFRRRVSPGDFGPVKTPIDLLASGPHARRPAPAVPRPAHDPASPE